MSDETEERQEQSAETAFEQAKAGFELFGQPLANYSPSRKIAAQSMGMLYPYLGEARAAQFEETGMYPGLLEDALILLWLCKLPDNGSINANWTPNRASKNPAKAKLEAVRWGTEKGIIETSSKEFQEAQQVFMAIVSGVEASKFRLNIPGAQQTEEEPGKV